MPRPSITGGLVLSATIAAFVLGGLLGQHFNRAKETRAKISERMRVQMDAGNQLAATLPDLKSDSSVPSTRAHRELEEMLYEYAFVVHEQLQRPAGLSEGRMREGREFIQKAGEYYWEHRRPGEAPEVEAKYRLETIFAPFRPASAAAPASP